MDKSIKKIIKTEEKAVKQTKALLPEDRKHDKLIDKAKKTLKKKGKK